MRQNQGTDCKQYEIEKEFSKNINNYFDEFERSDIQFPNYKGMYEGEYLRSISGNGSFHLMDQKPIRIKNASSNIEFCDLLTNDHDIIHVKKYSSSLERMIAEG